jgi:O-antigen/teichoic acid export membrane protein
MHISIRLQRVLLGFSSTFASKGIGLFCQLITTAALAKTLSSESFGIWAILLSLIILSPCFDFGLGGPVLRNFLTENKEGKEFYFSITSLLLVIYGVLGLFLFVLFQWLPVASFFHIKDPYLQSVASLVFGAASFLLAIRIPFAMNADAFYGYHETHIRGALDGIEVVILSAVAIALAFLKVTFLSFITIYFFIYAMTSVASFLIFLKRRGWQFKWVYPRKALEVTLPHRKVSLSFWVQNMVGLLLFSQLTSFVAHFTNASLAGDFSLIFRLFSIAIGVHFAFMNPLWGNYKEALLQRDFAWIKKTLRLTLLLTFLAFALLIPIMVYLHADLIFLWTKKRIDAPLLVSLTGLWTLLYALINSFSIFLNARSKSGVQAITFTIGVLLVVVFSQVVAPFGISAVLALHSAVLAATLFFLGFVSLQKLDD